MSEAAERAVVHADECDWEAGRMCADCARIVEGWRRFAATASSGAKRRGLGKKTIALREVILGVLKDFALHHMSSRQVYYQLVSREAVERGDRSVRQVQRQLVDMRLEKLIPFSRIVDRRRAKHQRPSWEGMEDMLTACSEQFRRDIWTDQPIVPMIACEKQALEGIFAEACDEYGVSLWPICGMNSWSFAYEWSEEIKQVTEAMAAGKRVVIAYFGDADPPGLNIENDCRKKLDHFGVSYEWHRLGLHPEDFDRFNLVRLPLQNPSSPSAKRFRHAFGPHAAELDALPPDELQHRIRQFIEQYPTFTLCAFPRSYRPALNLLGTLSGRDGDKIAQAGLTPVASSAVAAPGYAQAELIVECRKIHWQDYDPAHFLDPEIDRNYPNKDYHRMYFGEIVAIRGSQAYK